MTERELAVMLAERLYLAAEVIALVAQKEGNRLALSGMAERLLVEVLELRATVDDFLVVSAAECAPIGQRQTENGE